MSERSERGPSGSPTRQMTWHRRVSVSGICTMPASLDDDIAFWRDAGIDHVGVPIAKLEVAGWERGIAAVTEAGVRVSNLIGPGAHGLDRSLAAAEALGAGCVVFTTGPATTGAWEDACESLAALLAPHRGSRLAVEHTNSLRPDISFLHTLRDAIDVAHDLAIGVCMEVNACWLERDLAGTVRRGIDVIRLVQLSDFVLGTTATPDRAVPGDGDIPLERIIGLVLDAGYEGAFDLELIGPRITAEGEQKAALRSLDALSELLDRLGG